MTDSTSEFIVIICPNYWIILITMIILMTELSIFFTTITLPIHQMKWNNGFLKILEIMTILSFLIQGDIFTFNILNYHITMIWYPRRSPDLNPAEQVGCQIKTIAKKEIAQKEIVIRSKDELWNQIENAYNKLANNRQLFMILAESMQNRLAEVRNVQGQHTKYWIFV